MKKIIETTEDKQGLEDLLGERVTLFCCRYIYTGILYSIDNTCVMLRDGGIVYETGAFNETDWKDYQALPGDWFVMLQTIESFGILK